MAAPMNNTFQIVLHHIFESWTALRLAVEGGFGGAHSKEKADWMIEATAQWFSENENLELDEVSDFLADILNAEFDTVVDDGSLNKISENICLSWSLIRQGKGEEAIKQMGVLPKAQLNQCVQRDDSDDSDCSDEEEQHQSNSVEMGDSSRTSASTTERKEAPMDEDDDGWTTVGKKNKKR